MRRVISVSEAPAASLNALSSEALLDQRRANFSGPSWASRRATKGGETTPGGPYSPPQPLACRMPRGSHPERVPNPRSVHTLSHWADLPARHAAAERPIERGNQPAAPAATAPAVVCDCSTCRTAVDERSSTEKAGR